jgi:hypothetical protein
MEKTKNITESKTLWRMIPFNANSGLERMIHRHGFQGINIYEMIKINYADSIKFHMVIYSH